MRRIFVGDIQGCAHQLDVLLAAVEMRSSDRIYCVGDLVNRGPDSLSVLRRLRQLDARVVLGNHDLYLLRHARRAKRLDPLHPLAPILAATDRNKLLEWIGEQPVMRVEDDVVVVHAGLHPLWSDLPAVAKRLRRAVGRYLRGDRDAALTFATEVRNCDAEGERPAADYPDPGPPYRPWDDFYGGDRLVVFGHWAQRGLVVGTRTRGLDTGCVYGGPLTAWIAEEDRLVQVPGLPRPS